MSEDKQKTVKKEASKWSIESSGYLKISNKNFNENPSLSLGYQPILISTDQENTKNKLLFSKAHHFYSRI